MSTTEHRFFNNGAFDRSAAIRTLEDALAKADDGELYLEHRASEAYVFDDGRLKSASFDTTQGFGLRAIVGDTAAYAHASDLSHDAIQRASRTVGAVRGGHGGAAAPGPHGTNSILYADANPLELMPFADKAKLLAAHLR